jgi:hypothetical protein
MKIYLFLSLAAVFALSACGGGGGSDGGATAKPIPTQTPEPDPDYIQGQALVTWQLPTQRENGNPLQPHEIGGFEVRYRKAGESDFIYIVYEGLAATSHTFENLVGVYEFQIAAYDTNGLYSQFVDLTPLH